MLNRQPFLGSLIIVGFTLVPQCYALVPLKDVYKGKPYIGAALNEAQITGRDERGDATLRAQFDSISPEDALKWQSVHPQPGVYSFAIPDQYVAFGVKHHMFIVGHTLVWHSQVPAWVFHDDKGNLVDRDTLLARMREHIFTVVGRYKGRIQTWDVVNEVLNDDGTLRQSLWLRIIGEDYIAKAFQFAHEADSNAQLTYNDYSPENETKRKGAIALVKKLKDAGVPITTVGMQGHLSLKSPSLEEEDATLSAFEKLGVKVAVSELDIDVLPRRDSQHGADVSLRVDQSPALNPYPSGLPDSVQEQLAKRNADLFCIYLEHRNTVSRVTFWGVSDADSWLNNWPVRGRTSYPLLFDREGKPKAAFFAIEGAISTGVK